MLTTHKEVNFNHKRHSDTVVLSMLPGVPKGTSIQVGSQCTCASVPINSGGFLKPKETVPREAGIQNSYSEVKNAISNFLKIAGNSVGE